MRIEDLVIDAELESFLPALTDEERAELKAQIERDGFTDPIIVWLNHATIVDGHNRYRIWQEMGSSPDNCPEIIEKKFADKAAVMAWMFQRQTGRRNWTPGQRSVVTLKMKPAIEERAKENEKAGGGDKKSKKQQEKSGLMNSSNPISPVNTRKELAKIAGVSEDTIRKTEVVLKEGTPEVKASLASGEMSASAAFTETRRPSHGTKFDPSEWEDGPDRTDPASDKQQRKAKSILDRMTGDFTRAHGGLAPLVNAFDDIKVANSEFARKHKELLGHHSRLFQLWEDGKRVLAALNAAWVRK